MVYAQRTSELKISRSVLSKKLNFLLQSVGTREELKLCTSASEKDGAEVADDDRANLDCTEFTALDMATL